MKKWLSSTQFNFAAKALFAALLIGAIVWDFSKKDQTEAIWGEFLKNWAAARWPFLAVVVLLIPLNWATETLKWHQFVQRFEPNFSFFRGFQAVLAGVAFSLFLPNRVGEYGGRIFFVKKENQWKAVIANLVGNFSQTVVLLAAGAVGAAHFMFKFLKVDALIAQAVALLGIGASAVLLFVYFNIDLLVPLGKRLPGQRFWQRFAKNLKVLREFTRRELAEILAWSTIRCLIYAAQYFLLLRFFNIETSFVDGLAGIFAVFFVQMSVPLPPITGLLARGNVALHIWGVFGANEVSILAATLGLWLLNLVVPSLFGLLFLMRRNLAKSLGV